MTILFRRICEGDPRATFAMALGRRVDELSNLEIRESLQESRQDEKECVGRWEILHARFEADWDEYMSPFIRDRNRLTNRLNFSVLPCLRI
jgi:hypothetical protein